MSFIFQVVHMKVFLPFSIHLDPYIRKVIREERSSFIAMQSGEERPANDLSRDPPLTGPFHPCCNQQWAPVTLPAPAQLPSQVYKDYKPIYPSIPTLSNCDYGTSSTLSTYIPMANQQCFKPSLPAPLSNKLLSTLSAEEVGELLRHMEGLRSSQVSWICFCTCVTFSQFES